ncbi:predicted protein [Naegleria gruberi]|uniref:Predicted protein n=1 Tax=Naegleria gruberi TaxID=5762 RepID=D2V6K2_NAEGR|nr:uncharacterized protein NAEGRDRAFT_64468 [Naegleria gruberi]EFC47593.1 predicted protein [Naegleria gruberi]|eukprot:XP_002680337.1 predicted protein [Naegleria gruberi strain NEG-M]
MGSTYSGSHLTKSFQSSVGWITRIHITLLDIQAPLRDIVNITTGDIVKVNSTVDLTPYVPAKQDFFIYTLKNYYEKGLEGVYGEPYKVLGSTVAIYYSQLMYDPEIYKLNKTKSLVGLAKVNLSLETIVNFLSKIELLGRGYVLVAQDNFIVIGGSIDTISGDGLNSTNIFDVKSRNAGSLMKQFYELNNRTFSILPSVMKIVGESDGVSYIITPYKYVLENMQWNIFFVLYESEVTEALILTTSISIGVTVGIIVLGIVGSFVTGLVVSRPMKFLEKQFERIKVLDLGSVSNNSSMFREVNSIFNNLKNTVEWLAEIKTFIPQSVFEQIQNEHLEHVENQQELEKNAEISRNSISASNASRSHFSSKSTMKKGQHASNLFKMGLSKKGCAVIHVKIDGLSSKSPDSITTIFGDIVNLLGPIVKLSQGNLNVFSCDEFQLSLNSNSVDVRLQEKAFDAALKIVKVIESLQKKITARVGVSIGDGYVGNIGSSTARYFSMVGSVSEQAKTSQLASKFNVKIITDDCSISSSQKLVYRPLDRIQKVTETSDDSIFTIYDVIAQKLDDQDDEWLYSLENSKKNNKFQEYSKVFDLFTTQYWKAHENLSQSDAVGYVGHAFQILKQFSEQEFKNHDVSCDRIISCLSFILDNQQSFKSCESICKYLTSYSNVASFELVNKRD